MSRHALNSLAALRSAGFVFPLEKGLFRHPLRSNDGAQIDPRVNGFELITTGGGCEAFELNFGKFRILLTDENGQLPIRDWEQALIGVYPMAYEDGEDVATVTGKEWMEMLTVFEQPKDNV